MRWRSWSRQCRGRMAMVTERWPPSSKGASKVYSASPPSSASSTPVALSAARARHAASSTSGPRARAMPAFAEAPRAGRGGHASVVVFAGTLVLSALLLFSVQPMLANMLLPLLGGAPATWAVSLCFFQALLLAGYAYAHLLGTKLGTRPALAVHALVLLVACASLPIALPENLGAPQGSPYLWLLATLTVLAGLPFFALSASAPLLQLCFGRIGHRLSQAPYFLYAASNAGSLIALLAYPVLIEPLLPLPAQSCAWAWGFLILAVALGVCGVTVLARVGNGPFQPERDPAAAAAGPPSWGERASW